MEKLPLSIGQTYGRLTILEFDSRDKKQTYWLCECSCEEKTRLIVRGGNLRSGNTKSCGCFCREVAGTLTMKHGMSKSPTYRVWCSILSKCYNKNNGSYKNYGGKGIQVCERWKTSFQTFLSDMGKKPEKCVLGRKDSTLDFTPKNCYWVSGKQWRAERSLKLELITYKTETHSISVWSEKTGIKRSTLLYRIKKGWDVEKIFTPPEKRNKKCLDKDK